jgi:uncharacterized protein (TIGR00369 family)
MIDPAVGSRSYAWPRSALGADQRAAISGLDYLRGVQEGRYAPGPIAATIGWTVARVDPGAVDLLHTPGEWLDNNGGVVQGGALAALLDGAMACATISLLPPGHASTTLEMKVNFVRAVSTRSGEVRAEGRVLHFGRRIATAEARLLDHEGVLLAHATSTCMVLAPRGA